MIRDAAFGLLVVLAASTDWGLALPTETDCAKSQETCEMARYAITRGWLDGILPDTATRCEPMPQGCFSPESNVIRGYND